MNRNTLTTLGQLQDGDRFHFLKKTDVWQKESSIGTLRVSVQQYAGNKALGKWPIIKPAGIQCVFLRHTKPVPGEQLMMQDLPIGSIYYYPEDVITEYIVIEKVKDTMFSIICPVSDRTKTAYSSPYIQVVFIKMLENEK